MPKADNIFKIGDFSANRELVWVNQVPELTRVVGRDDEGREVGRELGSATEGEPSESIILYEKGGTKKSLVARIAIWEVH